MRFHTGQHRYYCAIDLHARTMYLRIQEHASGDVVLPRKLRCDPELFPHHNPAIAGAVLRISLRAIRTTLRQASSGAGPGARIGGISGSAKSSTS